MPGRGGRHWAKISDRPNRDAPVGDPAMGGHAAFALGLALARPNDKVVLFDSEGDILMSLGILPTIAEQAPANFYHFMLDNECYATTGGQPVPNAKNVAYDVIARGCRLSRAHSPSTQLEEFQANIASILAQPGPGLRGPQGAAGGRERADRPAAALADAHAGPRPGRLRAELGIAARRRRVLGGVRGMSGPRRRKFVQSGATWRRPRAPYLRRWAFFSILQPRRSCRMPAAISACPAIARPSTVMTADDVSGSHRVTTRPSP